MQRMFDILMNLWWGTSIVGYAIYKAFMEVGSPDQLEYGEWLNESTLFVWIVIGGLIHLVREHRIQFRS